MSQQKLLHLMAPEGQLSALTKRLESHGFQVRPSGRMSGGIHVRIREGTNDEAQVEEAAAAVAPEMRRGPSGAPTHNIVGYRE